MKKTNLILAFLLFFVTISQAQTSAGWIDYKMDNRISVKLPTQPKTINPVTQYAQGKDSAVYVLSLVDMKASAGLDSAQLVTMGSQQEFADGLKNGMGGAMPGYTLGDIKIGKWKNYNSYTMDGENPSQKIKLQSFMVLVGDKIYGISLMLHNGKTTPDKDFFFQSLTLH